MEDEEYLDLIKDHVNTDFLDVMCNVLGYSKEDIKNQEKSALELMNRFGVLREEIDDWLGIKPEKKEEIEENWDCSCLPEDFTEEDFNYALSLGKDEDEKNDLGFI